jgi:hypothetical protein
MPQNFSGRSMAYTKYTNAATLSNNDNRVMVSLLDAITQRHEPNHGRECTETEQYHSEYEHHALLSHRKKAKGRTAEKVHDPMLTSFPEK